jgi:hypothetical protein
MIEWLTELWHALHADMVTLGRMVVAALSYPSDFAGDIVS